ncbi:MAG: hypothetical protein AAFR55_00650 [Pseudomonadota bacterium]
MSKTDGARDETTAVDLEVFLDALAAEQAGPARVAAHRMDQLERSIDDVRDIEGRYSWVGWLAGALFIVPAQLCCFPARRWPRFSVCSDRLS